MAIIYDNLFTILKDKGLSRTWLNTNLGLSSRTIAKLSKGENVSISTINDICNALDCTPGDIMTFSKDYSIPKLLATLKEEREMQLKGGIYHLTQIKMTYNSNHIEGSTLTEDQTKYIYETNTLGLEKDLTVNIDDIIETANHFRCIDYVIKHAEEILTQKHIKDLHYILKVNTSDSRKEWFAVGEYKKRPNFVSDKKTTLPSEVDSELSKLLKAYSNKQNISIDDIIKFHHKFECIHPFQDGNGRVGRLIAFKECLKNAITPFIIDDKMKFFYYRGLKEWENTKEYLLDTCKSGQDNYSELINYFIKD